MILVGSVVGRLEVVVLLRKRGGSCEGVVVLVYVYRGGATMNIYRSRQRGHAYQPIKTDEKRSVEGAVNSMTVHVK